MKLTVRYFSLLFIIAFANFTHAQKAVENKNLPNFSQVNANFYRGGQPSEAGVKGLARMGVKTIINLRGADENSKPEERWAQNAGIKIISYNLSNRFGPKDTEIERIIADINKAENQPVFIHCRRGADRTGTVAAVYRIRFDHWTAKQANAEAKKFGFGWWQIWMKDYISDYSKEFKMRNEQ